MWRAPRERLRRTTLSCAWSCACACRPVASRGATPSLVRGFALRAQPYQRGEPGCELCRMEKMGGQLVFKRRMCHLSLTCAIHPTMDHPFVRVELRMRIQACSLSEPCLRWFASSRCAHNRITEVNQGVNYVAWKKWVVN